MAIIQKVVISKFRGFSNAEFEMGNQITVIAGQNGTQKTTLLGLLSQPFSLTNHEKMKDAKPLCGGNYRSSFAEKFKLSTNYDTPNSHEWSLYLHDESEPFVLESIARDRSTGQIRFWKKGDRRQGSGYIHLPVIYLSLKRLVPIGEDTKLQESENVQLTLDEKKLYQELHNEILISLDKIDHADYLESPDKATLGVNTDYYDWMQNSAGQDTAGKIILALLSFKRLKEEYKDYYKGGLLVIDEIDATMYPASQNKLLVVLRKYASRLSIQIVFTTHSLSLLEKACNLQKELSINEATKNQVNVLFLEKIDKNIIINSNTSYETIKNRLNVSLREERNIKLNVFTEDKEAILFTKKLLGTKSNKLKFINITMPCSSLIDLSYRKVPSFSFPESLIIIDGDVRNDNQNKNKIKKTKNILLLPGIKSPERAIAELLYNLSEADELWKDIHRDYSKQLCFSEYKYERICRDRYDAKKWFIQQKSQLKDRWCTKTIKRWKKEYPDEFRNFISEFTEMYNKFAFELGIDTL